MNLTRRDFIRGGVAAFTVSFGAPAFLSDIARAQGASRRNLVVLYLAGGTDTDKLIWRFQGTCLFGVSDIAKSPNACLQTN